MKCLSQSRNSSQLWMCLVVTVKSDAVKNNIAWGPGMFWLFGKEPDAGKEWREQEKGQQRMRWLDDNTKSMDMNLSKLREIVEEGEAWHVAVHEVAKSQTRLSNWITKIKFLALSHCSLLLSCCASSALPHGQGRSCCSYVIHIPAMLKCHSYSCTSFTAYRVTSKSRNYSVILILNKYGSKIY